MIGPGTLYNLCITILFEVALAIYGCAVARAVRGGPGADSLAQPPQDSGGWANASQADRDVGRE